MGEKQQFNVNLDADLVRRVKHHAVDVQLSLSDLVASVLTAYLESASPVRLQPMVHVEEMAASVGAQLQVATPDGLLVKVNRLEPDLYT
jgi:hypothetical protein